MKRRIIAIVFFFLGRGFAACARLDSRVKREVGRWADGTVVTLRVAPSGPQTSWGVNDGVFRHLGSRPVESTLLVTFKNPDGALPVFLGMKGVLQAFAEHRSTLAGDISLGMSVVRCLHIVEGYLFPAVMTRRILPSPAHREKPMIAAYALTIAISSAPVFVEGGAA
ncbi:MAG: hypothetical protein CVT59_05945 [Actinobacteria bacterium HGW-Actinobacteria-1]|jgi:hypothetical protein|nr:MAG: hypothetical protein CVT59_05945 [Actinobacteria bacterium HGW-Actinobacteria-1]